MVVLGLAVFVLIMHLLYENRENEKTRKYIWIIACAAVVLFVGFRSDHTGADTPNYINMFKEIPARSWEAISHSEFRDVGFFYFLKALSTVTKSKLVFLVFTSFLSFIGVFDLVKRNTDKPVLALFFFVTLGNFFFLLTGMRQAIAMSMCMLSVRFIQERKLIPFLILVWLGAQMHRSAYIFIVTYFLATRKVTPVSMITNIIITVIAYFSYEFLLDVANDILNYDYDVQELSNGGIFYMVILAIVILGFVTRDKWVTDNKNQTVIMNIGIMCGIIWTFRLIGRTAERPSMYFLNAIPIILINSAETLEKEESQKILLAIAVLLAFILFFKRATGLPYHFFWENIVK